MLFAHVLLPGDFAGDRAPPSFHCLFYLHGHEVGYLYEYNFSIILLLMFLIQYFCKVLKVYKLSATNRNTI